MLGQEKGLPAAPQLGTEPRLRLPVPSSQSGSRLPGPGPPPDPQLRGNSARLRGRLCSRGPCWKPHSPDSLGSRVPPATSVFFGTGDRKLSSAAVSPGCFVSAFAHLAQEAAPRATGARRAWAGPGRPSGPGADLPRSPRCPSAHIYGAWELAERTEAGSHISHGGVEMALTLGVNPHLSRSSSLTSRSLKPRLKMDALTKLEERRENRLCDSAE